MPGPLVTLLTDFGPASTYVGQLKGRLLTDLPDVRLVDLAHDIPPQNIRRAAVQLDECVDWFPPETIHLAIVDPGVGTARRLLYVRAARQHFVAPDNGLLDRVLRRHVPEFVRALDSARCASGPVSSTFHGRDLMAPTVIKIARGQSPETFSQAVDDWAPLVVPATILDETCIRGHVEWIDHFGNLISSIGVELLARVPPQRVIEVDCRSRRIAGLCRTYGEAHQGALLALVGSSGKLELAVNGGSAARELQAHVDDPVVVTWGPVT